MGAASHAFASALIKRFAITDDVNDIKARQMGQEAQNAEAKVATSTCSFLHAYSRSCLDKTSV